MEHPSPCSARRLGNNDRCDRVSQWIISQQGPMCFFRLLPNSNNLYHTDGAPHSFNSFTRSLYFRPECYPDTRWAERVVVGGSDENEGGWWSHAWFVHGFLRLFMDSLVPVFPAPVLDRLVGAPTYTSVVSRQWHNCNYKQERTSTCRTGKGVCSMIWCSVVAEFGK